MHDRTERTLFILLALVCAASRWLAAAMTLWTWDEALLVTAMTSFDITAHHPQPPGFPLFIGLAKFVRLFIASDFRALQLVNLIAGAFLFPSVYALGREFNLPYRSAVAAGVLVAFMPPVWFYGGTAYSDPTTLVLIIAAAALLLRGRRSPRDLLAGAFLFGCALGCRPQTAILVVAYPLFVALRESRVRLSVKAGAVALALVPFVSAFAAAIIATGGWSRFMGAIFASSKHIARDDSFLDPARPSPISMLERFFIKQQGWTLLGLLLALLTIIAVVQAWRSRDRGMFMNAATFLPYAIAAWLMLDRFSTTRYGIIYAPMFGYFAAYALQRMFSTTRSFAIAAALVAGASAVWTAPAFTRLRNEPSPPVAAVESLRQRIGPAEDLFVAFAMVPYVELFAPDRRFVIVQDENALPLTRNTTNAWLVAEVDRTQPASGQIFSWPRDRLWEIGWRRYFSAGFWPTPETARFFGDWSPAVRNGREEWLEVRGRGAVLLPSRSGNVALRLTLEATEQADVAIELNGRTLDRIGGFSGRTERTYFVTPDPGDSTLVIVTTGLVRLRWLGWASRVR